MLYTSLDLCYNLCKPSGRNYADFHADGAETCGKACRAAKAYTNFIPANSAFSEL
jgi:hypothetical protein